MIYCRFQMLIIDYCLDMFRASLCPSSGEKTTCYCIWGCLLVVLDVAGCGTVVLRCRVWALWRSLLDSFTVLTPYSNLHSAHTLQQPSQCSHPTATFTVLTPYSDLHSAHTLQQPLQCSHPTATFTVLTPYSDLQSAHTIQQPSQCSHPTM